MTVEDIEDVANNWFFNSDFGSAEEDLSNDFLTLLSDAQYDVPRYIRELERLAQYHEHRALILEFIKVVKGEIERRF